MTALNTHGVGIAGILSFVVGLLCYGPFQVALDKAFPNLASDLALIFIVAGFAAAYFGRPGTVPKG